MWFYIVVNVIYGVMVIFELIGLSKIGIVIKLYFYGCENFNNKIYFVF